MVGRERRGGGSGERAGRKRTTVQPGSTLGDTADILVGSEGRGRLGRPRPRKHRRHEARSGVLVSEANEGQRDAVSRGRGTSSGRGLSRTFPSPQRTSLFVDALGLVLDDDVDTVQ